MQPTHIVRTSIAITGLSVTLLLSACNATTASLTGTLATVLLNQTMNNGSATTSPTASTMGTPSPGSNTPFGLPSPQPSAVASGLPNLPVLTGGATGSPTSDERAMYEAIMTYRASLGLPRIPLSRSLTIVAQTHAADLQAYPPDEDAGCNMHSWSSHGPWKAMCYTDDHAEAEAMWSKPRELTSYPGSGYEIAYGSWGAHASPQGAVNGWKSSSGHNAVMANLGSWSDNDWGAIGVGMSDNYAVAWFGEESDPTGSP